jgi:hypothetical protein
MAYSLKTDSVKGKAVCQPSAGSTRIYTPLVAAEERSEAAIGDVVVVNAATLLFRLAEFYGFTRTTSSIAASLRSSAATQAGFIFSSGNHS